MPIRKIFLKKTEVSELESLIAEITDLSMKFLCAGSRATEEQNKTLFKRSRVVSAALEHKLKEWRKKTRSYGV